MDDRSVHARGKVVGRVSGGVFRKRVRGSRHMLRNPRAWALDTQSLLDAERLGARVVAITDTETGRTFSASVALIRWRGFTFDRGHGRQIALPLGFWTVTARGQGVPVQLSLLEVAP